MRSITCCTTYLPFLCKALEFTATPLAQCIVCVDEAGYPVAGVIYDGYNGAIVHAHIWMDAEKRPLREWYAAIFDYPFNRMGVRKIIGQVNSNNIEAQNLDVNFGFTLEAELKDYYEDGASLLVYTLTRENCKILNSPLWERVVNKMSRAE